MSPGPIRIWQQAPPGAPAWECERGHRRPVPPDIDPVHKYEACRYPVGARTACGAGARLVKGRVVPIAM